MDLISNFSVGKMFGSGAFTGAQSASVSAGIIGLMVLLAVWTIVWKALALWKSARRGEKVWFIILLVINTMGILEIIYLLINREPKVITTPNTQPNTQA